VTMRVLLDHTALGLPCARLITPTGRIQATRLGLTARHAERRMRRSLAFWAAVHTELNFEPGP